MLSVENYTKGYESGRAAVQSDYEAGKELSLEQYDNAAEELRKQSTCEDYVDGFVDGCEAEINTISYRIEGYEAEKA